MATTETWDGNERRSTPRTGNIEDVTVGMLRKAKEGRIPSKTVLDDPNTKFTEGNEMREELRLRVGETVGQKGDETREASPENPWLVGFKIRFDALPQLHAGVEWSDVEKSLQADPESMRKLQELDAAGFEMNVFRAKNSDEIQFRTAQRDVTKITQAYRTIMYDEQAETDYPQYRVNGNAEGIATRMGVELADKELYEQLRVRKGWVWLKTDRATRDTGRAFFGSYVGVGMDLAYTHSDNGSFCAALRVKKVS